MYGLYFCTVLFASHAHVTAAYGHAEPHPKVGIGLQQRVYCSLRYASPSAVYNITCLVAVLTACAISYCMLCITQLYNICLCRPSFACSCVCTRPKQAYCTVLAFACAAVQSAIRHSIAYDAAISIKQQACCVEAIFNCLLPCERTLPTSRGVALRRALGAARGDVRVRHSSHWQGMYPQSMHGV